MVQLVIAWEWQGMAVQIQIWGNTHFWENDFWLMWQVIAQKCCPFLHASMFLSSRMIVRNHTYLKVYKCSWLLPILKTTIIKWLAIFFKKYSNFQGLYIVYIIIWNFWGEKFLPHQNWAKQGFKKCKMTNLFWKKTWKNSPLG